MLIEQRQAPSSTAPFFAALDNARFSSSPFPYWLLQNILPDPLIDALAALPLPVPENMAFEGRREANNAARLYFSPENQTRFPICRALVAIFKNPYAISKLEALTGAHFGGGRLRIEYCQDSDGFWLEPHCDIREKLFTMLIYLSDDPALFDAGTDIYTGPPQHQLATRVPYKKNAGLIFIPSADTWHGFSRRPLHGLRKSLIINYVSPGWRATGELS